MPHENITTVSRLIQVIGQVKQVRIQPRFGLSESWVRITKAEALDLAKTLTPDTTPESMEMYSGVFGTVISKILYLG